MKTHTQNDRQKIVERKTAQQLFSENVSFLELSKFLRTSLKATLSLGVTGKIQEVVKCLYHDSRQLTNEDTRFIQG